MFREKKTLTFEPVLGRLDRLFLAIFDKIAAVLLKFDELVASTMQMFITLRLNGLFNSLCIHTTLSQNCNINNVVNCTLVKPFFAQSLQ